MKRIIIALALLASTATAQAQNYAKPDPNAPPAPTLPGPGRVALPGDEIRLRIPWTIGRRDKMLLSEWYGLVKADRLAMAAEFAGAWCHKITRAPLPAIVDDVWSEPNRGKAICARFEPGEHCLWVLPDHIEITRYDNGH